jgi:hypothetical protein
VMVSGNLNTYDIKPKFNWEYSSGLYSPCFVFDKICISCGVQDRIKDSTSVFLPRISATKGLITLTPQINCDQTAMGLPSVSSAVFLIAKQFW